MTTSCATLIASMMLAFTAGRGAEAHSQERLSPAPVRAITRGAGFHWFGYYDKLQFDPSGRFVLGMQVAFENRNPTPDDVVRIGMVDLEDGDRWIELGESRAWCWQQGCHLQWRPGSDREVIWNDRQDGKLVAVVLDVKAGQRRLLPRPVDNLSPDGKWALGVDFARIRDFRAGYGYAGVADPHRDLATPEDSGVYRMDLDTGESRLLVSLAQSAAIGPQHPSIAAGARRYINHVQWSPDGRRFLFLERPSTRLMTAASDGSDLRVVMFDASHYTWRDPRSICVWTGGGYRLYADEPLAEGKLLWSAVNGHQTYFPDRDWLLTDTYPDARRMQTIYLFNLPTARRIDIGEFACPPEYRGDWRADLHPRLSPDGRRVCFDSAHEAGRQMYLMDLGGIGPNPPGRGRRASSLSVAASERQDSSPSTLSRSFEVRHISNDPAADSESDFLGPTSVLSTEQRVEYLRVFAAAARRNFATEGWDRAAVEPRQVSAALARLKPPPAPEVRRRLPIDRWRWLGHREGQEHEDRAKLLVWQQQKDLVARGDGILGFHAPAEAVFSFPAQDWRFLVRLKLRRVGETLDPATIRVGDAVVFAVDGRGRLRSGETVVGSLPLNTWTELRIEVALDDAARCFNLEVDGQPWVRAGGIGAGARVDRVTFGGLAGWEIGDCWVQSYSRTTAHPQIPISMITVCDETFRVRPAPTGFAELGYDDRLWPEAPAPFAHGGERRAGEHLYLRHRFEAPAEGRVWLHCETLFPGGEVWLNGRVIHVQHDPRPLRLDLTRFLARGGANVLALRVSPFLVQRHIAHGPADRNSGWFAGRAWLDLTHDDFIEDVFASTLRLKPDPTMRVRVRLNTAVWAPVDSRSKSDPSRARNVRIRVRPWFPQTGAIAAETVRPAKLAYFGRPLEMDFEVPLPGGELWSPERPFLYCVEVRLETPEGQALDDLPVITGLRTVDQAGGVFRLNGRPELLRGGLLFGMRPPLEDQAVNLRCAPLAHLVREVLLAKAVGGNCLRMTVHEGTYLGCNDPRLAEIGDQLGVCFLWSTSAWVRTASPWQIDLGLLAEDAKLVRNHPSIVMWQPGNHPIFFTADDGMAWWREVFYTLLEVDDSRLISPVGGSGMIHPPSDDGRRSRDGRTDLVPEPTWVHRLAGRGDFDCPTGYRKPPGVWPYLRLWPETPDWTDGEFVWTRSAFKREYIESKTHAWFDFESEETIGQPNWDLLRGSPIWRIMSYEHGYDEMSIGRRLDFHEWEISQAWQALSASEAYRKKRLLDYDGMFWCPLDGGGNTGTYQKPVTDHLGHAKMAFYALRMLFQPTLAGSGNVDVSYGPGDAVPVCVMHLGDARTVDVVVRATSPTGEVWAETSYRNVHLEAGRTVKALAPWKPRLPAPGYAVFEYFVRAPKPARTPPGRP